MDDAELVRRLKNEESDAASYHASELAKAQADHLRWYYCEPYGNEIENRSQIVTPDVRDAINWALPGLLRPFMASEDFVVVESQTGQGDLGIVADVLSHVFFKDNPGERILHDFCFDGLAQRVGIAKTAWEDPQKKPARTLEGVPPEQVQRYAQDPEYEILAIEPDPETGTFMIEVQHAPRMGRVCVEVVAPEDFAISRRARSIEEADYHRLVRRNMLRSEVAAMFPDSAEDLEAAPKTEDEDGDTRFRARHNNESARSAGTEGEPSPRVDLFEEYIRIDHDGDGVPELRAIKRVGDVILENIAIEEPELTIWSPFPVAHRAIGLGMADVVGPYQRVRTELTRRALDNMAQVLVPRKVVNVSVLDDSDPTALQTIVGGGIGSTARVRGNVREAVADLTTPDISTSAAAMLDYFDRRKQEASGVSAQGQGIDPQMAHKTATGVDLIQSASNARIEMIARWLAYGVEGIFNRILKLIVTHQDQSRIMKLRGKPMQIMPAMWPDDMLVRVHVGMATASRERQIANLGTIMTLQEKVLASLGQQNPMVTLHEVRSTFARIVETMGYKAPEQFVKEIPENWQPPPPGPDPKTIEAQKKLELKAQEDQAKHQREMQKMAADIQLERERMAGEFKLAVAQMQAEMDLAVRKALLDAETKREIGRSQPNGSARDDIESNRPGGKLDA